jgi:hypothetical protein
MGGKRDNSCLKATILKPKVAALTKDVARHTPMSWAVLEDHRQRAAAYRLNILVWGPSDDGSREYSVRCRLKDEFLRLGHDARFSEELCAQPNALHDPMNDERLQAEAAHLIVMIYGSRGTQTERDFILTDRDLAAKAIILVERRLYEQIKTRALAGKSWEEMSGVATILQYKKSDSEAALVRKVCELTHKIRTALYVRDLRRRTINV